jgi:hypothetical protein
MKLNQRQYDAAVNHIYQSYEAEGLSKEDADAEIANIPEPELIKTIENAFVDLKTAEGRLISSENISTPALALNAADTATFGYLGKAASYVGGKLLQAAGKATGLVDSKDDPDGKLARQVFEEEWEDNATATRIESPVASTIGQIGGYFVGPMRAVTGGTAILGKAAGGVVKGTGAVSKVGAGMLEAGVAGAAQYGIEQGIREDGVGFIKGTLTGGALGAGGAAVLSAPGLLYHGGKIAASKTLGFLAKRGRELGPEASELIDKMDDVVKQSKAGTVELGKKVKMSFDEIGDKLGSLFAQAKDKITRSFDETQIVKGTDLKDTLLGMVDDASIQIGTKATETNSIARKDILQVIAQMDDKMRGANKILSLHYDEALTTIMKKADDAKLLVDIGDPLSVFLKSLPEGAIVNGKANSAMLGDDGAKTLNALLRFKNRPLKMRTTNEVKKRLGNSINWDKDAVKTADSKINQTNQAMRDLYSGIKDKMESTYKTIDPDTNITDVFAEYASGLELISTARSAFTKTAAITENYATKLDFIELLNENRKHVKVFDKETSHLIKNGIRNVRKVLDSEKLQDPTEVRKALFRALDAPDSATQLSNLEAVGGALKQRREMTAITDQIKLHPKLLHGIKNPMNKEAQQVADEFLAKASPESRNAYRSIVAKEAKRMRLKALGKPAEMLAEARATGQINPQLIDEVEDVVSLIPEFQKALSNEKLLKMVDSPLFKELTLGKQLKASAAMGVVGAGAYGGVEYAMDKLGAPKWAKNTVRIAGTLLLLKSVINRPLYLARLNSELKLNLSQAQLEKTIHTLNIYNEKIRPMLVPVGAQAVNQMQE